MLNETVAFCERWHVHDASKDKSAMVKDVHLAQVYIEKELQWIIVMYIQVKRLFLTKKTM